MGKDTNITEGIDKLIEDIQKEEEERNVNLVRLIRNLIFAILVIALTCYWYDWKLAVILFLTIFAHNLEKHFNDGK